MKKVWIFSTLIFYLYILMGCFQTRTQLFNLHIEEDTYQLDEDSEIIFDEKNILSFLSITFKDLNETVTEDSDFEVNTFGDFSFQEIKLFEVELQLGFNDNEPVKYDLNFLGRANPGRGNAYRFSIAQNEVNHVYNDVNVVLEFNTNFGGLDDKIGYLTIQLISYGVNKLNITVRLRNELEKFRYDSLELLNDTFESFNRDDYNQVAWDQIDEINKQYRDAIMKSLDIEVIEKLILEALDAFNDIPKINNN